MIVESDTLFIIKTLIIFPLIIYYSGSSKLCLLLFEFLKPFRGLGVLGC